MTEINIKTKHLLKFLGSLDDSLGDYQSWALSKAEYCQIGLLLKIYEALNDIKRQMGGPPR